MSRGSATPRGACRDPGVVRLRARAPAARPCAARSTVGVALVQPRPYSASCSATVCSGRDVQQPDRVHLGDRVAGADGLGEVVAGVEEDDVDARRRGRRPGAPGGCRPSRRRRPGRRRRWRGPTRRSARPGRSRVLRWPARPAPAGRWPPDRPTRARCPLTFRGFPFYSGGRADVPDARRAAAASTRRWRRGKRRRTVALVDLRFTDRGRGLLGRHTCHAGQPSEVDVTPTDEGDSSTRHD